MKKVVSVLCILLVLTLFGGMDTKIVHAETEVKSITIKTMPDKCAYNIGDGYTTKGMVVVATLSNGKKETVDNSKIASFSGVQLTEGTPFTQEGWKLVELQYKGAKTELGVAVYDPAKEYFITYNSDGGSAVEAKKIDASTKAFKLPEPTKEGYAFLGWYNSSDYKFTKYYPNMGPSIQLTAKWGTAIVFDANGGKGKMKYGVKSDDYKLPKSGFKKSGYNFVGWSTVKENPDPNTFYKVGTQGNYLSLPEGSTTLYAVWVKSKTYKISYELQKGMKLSKSVKSYKSGKTTKLPTVTNSAEFNGWIITINGQEFSPVYDIPPYVTGEVKLKPMMVGWEG